MGISNYYVIIWNYKAPYNKTTKGLVKIVLLLQRFPQIEAQV